MPRSLVMLVRVRVSPVPACVRARRPSAKPTTYGEYTPLVGEDAPLDAATALAMRLPARGPGVALQPRGASALPPQWLVAGSTPAPGDPESCWLPLCSQHSARLGLPKFVQFKFVQFLKVLLLIRVRPLSRCGRDRWLMARQPFGPFEAGVVAANDENDEASRLLWTQSLEPLA